MKQVLVVDDEESMRLLVERLLESIPDVRCTLADGGAETLKLVAERSYDLILLDLLMPGVGGIEVLKRLRQSAANKKTPVIVISVMADADTKIVCQSLGVTDYVTKPIERDALTRSVKAAL